MIAKLEVVLACVEKITAVVEIAVPAIREIISIFGDDVVCIETDED